LRDHSDGVFSNGVVSNCILVGNYAAKEGGAVFSADLIDCTIFNNQAAVAGGGASSSFLSNCILEENRCDHSGGGAYMSDMTHCTVVANHAGVYGGGTYGGGVTNCIIEANNAGSFGGGMSGSYAFNCVIRNNQADNAGGVRNGILRNCTVANNTALGWAGGTEGTLAYNTIIWGNTAQIHDNVYNGQLHYSCTTPLESGVGNIDQDPLLLDGRHIAANSPCMSAGGTNEIGSTNLVVSGFDIDGDVWGTPPSMGCDEVVGAVSSGNLSLSIQASTVLAVEGTTVTFLAEIKARPHPTDGAMPEMWSGISPWFRTRGLPPGITRLSCGPITMTGRMESPRRPR
jgi:hypothetical protein